MTVSRILFVVTMSMMSSANRLKLTPSAGVVFHPAVAPVMHQVSMLNGPVTFQRLHGPSVFPEIRSNASAMVFPIAELTANTNDTRIYHHMFPPSINYGMGARQLLENSAMQNYQQASSMETLDSSVAPTDPGPSREIEDPTHKKESDNALLSPSMDTVNSLDVDFFLGRWFQVFGSISSRMELLGNAGMVSDYSLNEDGSTINILNRNVQPGGQRSQIIGTLKSTNFPGRWKISLNKLMVSGSPRSLDLPDFEGDYWIYKLGPKRNNQYDYVVLGGPAVPKIGLAQNQVFVLARDPQYFTYKYGDEVRGWLNTFILAREV